MAGVQPLEAGLAAPELEEVYALHEGIIHGPLPYARRACI
jgi:hypothetical protein